MHGENRNVIHGVYNFFLSFVFPFSYSIDKLLLFSPHLQAEKVFDWIVITSPEAGSVFLDAWKYVLCFYLKK